MSKPRKLCSTCLDTLQSGLEDVLECEKTLHRSQKHHTTFKDFQEAASQDCFMCTKLWNSIRSDVLASWESELKNWQPLECSLSRRPWAAERYGAFYWHVVYVSLFSEELDLLDFDYQGNTFCLLKNEDVDGKRNPKSPEDNYESSTSSSVVHELAYRWYQVCHESHDICKKIGLDRDYTPTRLVDVGIQGENTWKLRLRSDDIVGSPDYLTVSYRWAPDPTMLLLSSNIDDYRQGACIQNLPKTFRDAITVARNFSIRYIWIDSLCIIQDSPEDWTRESVLMHDVYSNSACNIAASASEGPEGGLFRNRKPDQVSLGYIHVNLPNMGRTDFDIWDQFYMNRLTHGPLSNRGWVFQERVLSPRVLHFSRDQIAWECFEMNKCETWPRWSPFPTEVSYSRGLKTLHALFDPEFTEWDWPARKGDESKAMSAGVYNQWIHLVKTYSKHTLTCQDDRLIAMEGIANTFQRHTGDQYIAGLWKSRLLEGLNWIVINPLAQPLNRYRAPSWSWCAVDSAVLPQSLNLPRDDDLIEIIDANVEMPKLFSRGNEVHGYIELWGCLTEAVIQEGSEEGCARIMNKANASATPIKIHNFPSSVYVLPDTKNTAFLEGDKLHLLPLRSTLRRYKDDTGTEAETLLGTIVVILEGMILKQVPDKVNVYRRTGRFVVQELDHVDFFGLHTFRLFPTSTVDKVVVKQEKLSAIILV